MKVNARRQHQRCLFAIMTVVPGATIQKDAPVCQIILLFGMITKLEAIELTPKQYAEAMVRILRGRNECHGK